MLNKKDSQNLLNSLVTQGSINGVNKNTQSTISCYDAELALFTTMPNAIGNGAVEVDLNGYARKSITGFSISGNKLFETSAGYDQTERKYIIKNTSPIQMHSINEQENRSQSIVGFGIYAYEEESDIGDAGKKRLVAWGPLVDDKGNPVVAGETAPILSGGSVPVFYKDDFKLLFGGGEDGGLASTICIGILNTIVQKGSTSPTNGSNTYSFYCYRPELALFMSLPNSNGENAVEVPTSIRVPTSVEVDENTIEEVDENTIEIETGYSRKALWGQTATSTGMQFDESAYFSGVDSKIIIKNTDEIQMSCINKDFEDPNYPDGYTVLGFGIYAAESNSVDAEKHLVAWGPFVDADGNPVVAEETAPVLNSGAVPIFYTGNFKLLLGSDTTGGTEWVGVTGIQINTDEASSQFVQDGEITINSFTDRPQLTATVSPNNASDQSVTWESDDPDIATVDKNGNITAGSKKGRTKITATAEAYKDSCWVTSKTAVPQRITLTSSRPIRKYNMSGVPHSYDYDTYVTTITANISPKDVADADRKVEFEYIGVKPIPNSATDNTVQVYVDISSQSSYAAVTAKLSKDNKITGSCLVNIISN